MNLVAKEYVATKVNNPGVLVLSEMAGAAVELADAIQINPNDTDQIADAIFTALQMPYEEQAKRISKMQAILSVQTVNKWAADFMEEWKKRGRQKPIPVGEVAFHEFAETDKGFVYSGSEPSHFVGL